MGEYKPRRKRLDLSRFDTMQMHMRNPLMSVWAAASFAGFGQMMVGSYAKGFALTLGEIVINMESRLNLAIMYSFTGRFEMAKDILDLRWLLAYVVVYCYGLWDSYNLTISMNAQSVLASREKAPIDVFKMIPFSINFLDKRTPWVSLFWSFFVAWIRTYVCLEDGHRVFLDFFHYDLCLFISLVRSHTFRLYGRI